MWNVTTEYICTWDGDLLFFEKKDKEVDLCNIHLVIALHKEAIESLGHEYVQSHIHESEDRRYW